jgi:hypothetical protein
MIAQRPDSSVMLAVKSLKTVQLPRRVGPGMMCSCGPQAAGSGKLEIGS